MKDPRPLQIALLLSLLAYGAASLGFEITAGRVALVLGVALSSQFAAALLRGDSFDPRSALISGLSLCLLLRTDDPFVAAAAPALAIGSKYVVRRAGRHVFNPTALAIAVLIAVTDRAWISTGQWGSAAWLALLLAAGTLPLLSRAHRLDLSWAFLVAFAGLALGRGLWLGDPADVALHNLQNGALLVFAFFMLSDPRTSPSSRAGRIVFALLIAGAGFGGQYGLHRPDALVFALVACAPAVPVLDRLFPGPLPEWPIPKGTTDASMASSRSPLRPRLAGG